MKIQSKIFISLLLVCASFSTFAYTPFTSEDQASQYCPSAVSLVFTQNNPTIQNGAGSVSGKTNNNTFANFPAKKTALHPKNLGSDNTITDAQFREVNGIYGYMENNVITCLYSYTGFTGVDVALVMRSN